MAELRALQKKYQALKSDLKVFDVRGMWTLAQGLREFLRERVSVQQAEEEIKRALETREERFLELARTQVYERSGSPYLKLLKIAGCEFSDLREQVRCHGLERTLERLAGEGVYLTTDEFKGKKEVVRRGQSFQFSSGDFDRLDLPQGFIAQSSGTSNRPLRFLTGLDYLAARAFTICVFLSCHDLLLCSHAVYDAVLPTSGGIRDLLVNAKLGINSDRWFARKVPVPSRLEGWYHHLVTYLVVLTGKWLGPGFPLPDFIDKRNIDRIVLWILERRREGRSCCIKTVPSNAARIACTAREMGATLEGTTFIVGGEPFTDYKHEVIKRVGATAVPRYGFTEGGVIGFGCANPFHTDEMHVNQHMLTVIRHPTSHAAATPPVYPLLISTLHPTTPKLLLNVENGDYATLERRNCGCGLENVGLTLHLHHIRSYEKFTSEGMNYFYGDLYELLEQTLPSEFGGGPGDYQLVEEEDSNGQTRLTLRVHPEVGKVNEERLLSRLQVGLGQGTWGNRFTAKIWQDAGTLRIKREVPHASPRGKILPLHIRR